MPNNQCKVLLGEGGAEVSATFVPVAPTISNVAATQVTNSSARLEGLVNPNGDATTYQFEYLTKAAYEANGNSFSGKRRRRPRPHRHRSARTSPTSRSARSSTASAPRPNTSSGSSPPTPRRFQAKAPRSPSPPRSPRLPACPTGAPMSRRARSTRTAAACRPSSPRPRPRSTATRSASKAQPASPAAKGRRNSHLPGQPQIQPENRQGRMDDAGATAAGQQGAGRRRSWAGPRLRSKCSTAATKFGSGSDFLGRSSADASLTTVAHSDGSETNYSFAGASADKGTVIFVSNEPLPLPSGPAPAPKGSTSTPGAATAARSAWPVSCPTAQHPPTARSPASSATPATPSSSPR